MLRAWRRFHGSGGLRGSLADTPLPDMQPTGLDQEPQQAGGALATVSWSANPTYGSLGPDYGSKLGAGAAGQDAAQGGAGAAAADPFTAGPEGWCHDGYGPVTPTVTVSFRVEYLAMRRAGAPAMQLLNEVQGGAKHAAGSLHSRGWRSSVGVKGTACWQVLSSLTLPRYSTIDCASHRWTKCMQCKKLVWQGAASKCATAGRLTCRHAEAPVAMTAD
jgi:hypothetical protein